MVIDALVVAEKDSVARAIAKYLAQGSISTVSYTHLMRTGSRRMGNNGLVLGLEGIS
jgi:hypothetical protein